ncbi:MAG: TonB-dependent receptor [Paraprevotella sp.]|nr:TonB-dependent receptor [Paraprevotella sp.]
MEICAYGQIDSVMQSVTLGNVEVKGTRYTSHIKSHANGQVTLDLKGLGSMPKFLGNADPIRYSQLLPEIQTNGEYRSGVNIQGSESSHNLVTMGGVPIYNAGHLLGFFSTFNSSHFSQFSIAKMNDAKSCNRIGGELSMDLPCSIPDTLSGEVSLGLISSQGTIRLPIKGQTLLLASVRTSYVNALYGSWLKTEDLDMDYSFSDFNFTLLHKIDDHHDITLDYYGGFDKGMLSDHSYTAKMNAAWGNQMAGFHHHFKKDGLKLKNTLYVTAYKNDFSFCMQDLDYKLPSSILDIGIKHEAEWKKLSWGADAIYHDIKPQALRSTGTIVSFSSSVQSIQAAEVSFYAAYKYPIAEYLHGECGIRGSAFGSNQSKVRVGVDPSVNITYNNYKVELFAGYSLKHQYLFQTGFSEVGLPTEFWLPSDDAFRPQYAHSVNVGASMFLFSRRYKLSTNLFYKRLHNQMEYFGSVFDFVNAKYDLASHLQQGRGQNYGCSVILNKCTGKLSGWVSYTFTRARRTFQPPARSHTYPATHERPHEMNAVLTYSVGKHWDFGGTLVYASGTPFTAVKYLMLMNGNIISTFGEHNRARLQPYCRLDVSVNYKWKGRLVEENGINVSAYNVSARENELFYYLSTDRKGNFSYRSQSFFVDVLPSVSYFCKF